jgi:threonine dehydrogenase-like Zn-dependent dehydrogenase
MLVLQEGKLKPHAVTSHILPLKDAAKGYEIFNSKRECDHCNSMLSL